MKKPHLKLTLESPADKPFLITPLSALGLFLFPPTSIDTASRRVYLLELLYSIYGLSYLLRDTPAMFGIFADLLSYVLRFLSWSAAIPAETGTSVLHYDSYVSIFKKLTHTASLLQIGYYDSIPGFCFI